MGFSSRFRMMSGALLGVALAGGLGAALYGQTAKTMLVVPRGPLLPLQFGAWQVEGEAPSCRDCFQPEGQLADILKEDGLTAATRSPTAGRKARGRWR